jgi:hypothetical protein
MLILPVTVELLQADNWTDMMKLLVAFRTSAKSLKKAFITVCMQDRMVRRKIISLWLKKRKQKVK